MANMVEVLDDELIGGREHCQLDAVEPGIAARKVGYLVGCHPGAGGDFWLNVPVRILR
jgi:hypothetical protein